MIHVVTQSRLEYVHSEIKSALEAVERFTVFVNGSSEGRKEERETCRLDAIRHLHHAQKTLEQLQGQQG